MTTVEESSPLPTSQRALQAIAVATLATSMVLAGAALSSILFDKLPSYLDVVLVVFVFPFLLLLGVLMFTVKVVEPVWPNWLRQSNGREADLPGLIVGAVLAAAIASIYPGMFPGKTYAKLVVEGPAFEVRPETAPQNAGFYRFRDASLRSDLGGARTYTTVTSTGNITQRVRRVIHVAPILGRDWTKAEPAVAWAISEDELAPWQIGETPPLEGLRMSDERDRVIRAVRSVAEEMGLELSRRTLLIELGASYEEHLERSRRRTWLALAPLCLLVFMAVCAKTWAVLGPGDAS